MSQTTFANGRGIVHRASGGRSVVWPDVCKTPTPSGPAAIPYTNIGRSRDTSRGPTTVACEGHMPMVHGAVYSRSTGDEAGKLGGVISRKGNRNVCEFALWSFDVTFEGRGVCRLGDPLFHNHRNAFG
jgi:hypothetical protein